VRWHEPFSAQEAFASPFNFSFISANLGGDALHAAINSFPEVPIREWDERQFQCRANIDLQRWLTILQKATKDAVDSSPELYKVLHRDLIWWCC
jgi:hypothetical protein